MIWEAVDKFFKRPISGYGLLDTDILYETERKKGALTWYHMMPAQIIGGMGLIGVVCYGYQLYNRAKLIITKADSWGLVLGLSYLGVLLMSMVKMQGIQKKNFEWVIEQTQNLLLKKYEPKTGKFEGVCCIYDRSEYTAAQQFCRPVFFSENGKARREALELARVWVSIFKQLGLTPQKQIQIKKSEDSDKLVAVDVQPVAEP